MAPALNWLVGTLYDAAAFGCEYTSPNARNISADAQSDPTTKAESVGYSRELEVACAGLKEMHRRGIKILPGNDYGWVSSYYFLLLDIEEESSDSPGLPPGPTATSSSL